MPTSPIGRRRAAPLVLRLCLLIAGLLLIATPAASADYSRLRQFGSTGAAPGQMDKPLGLGVGPDGHVFVADGLNDRVEEFTGQGELVRTYGSSGTAPGQVRLPEDALSDGTSLYVSDCYNSRITEYRIGTGETVRVWDSTTSRASTRLPFRFNCPESLALSPAGLLYVSDTFNQRVVRFDPHAARPVLDVIGGPGTGPGQFTQPHGLQFDQDGNFLVGDNDPHTCGISRIQRFTPDGTFLSQFGTQGTGVGQLMCVLDIDQDGAGNIFASDAYGRLTTYAPDGTLIRQFAPSVGGSPFGYSYGIDSDGSCTLYSSEREAGVIRAFGFPDAPACRTMPAAPPAEVVTPPSTLLTIIATAPARVRSTTPVRLTVSCPFADCRLTATLTTTFRGKHARTVLTRARRQLTAATRVTLSLKATPVAQRRIRRWMPTHRTLPAIIEMTATTAAGATATKRRHISLVR